MRTFFIARHVAKVIIEGECAEARYFFKASLEKGEIVVITGPGFSSRPPHVIVISDGSTIFDRVSFRLWLRLRLTSTGWRLEFRNEPLPSSGYTEIVDV